MNKKAYSLVVFTFVLLSAGIVFQEKPKKQVVLSPILKNSSGSRNLVLK